MLETKLSLLEIMTFGHPVLTQVAQKVYDITGEIAAVAQNMTYTMHSAPGIGLAAPQVNQSIQLITVDLSVGEKEQDLFVLINPEIVYQEGDAYMEEGCLSVPEINEKVNRPYQIVVKAVDLNEKEVIIEAQDLLARVFCHEIDHLQGRLFIDHLSPLKRSLIKKKLLKQKENSGKV